MLEPLEAARRGATVGLLRRQAVLRRLAEALDAAGIPFVVLKGAALAHLAYPEPALRPMGDIDIWTAPELLDRAALVLIQAGIPYSSRMQARRATAKPLERETSRVFEATGTSVVLELHGVVRSMLAVTPGWAAPAWARAAPRDLGGISARVLHAEDMLSHLAVHTSAHHRFEMGLRPLLDIALWLEREGQACDWPGLAARWRRDGGLTWSCLSLVLAKELLAAAVPPGLLRRTDPAGGVRGAARACPGAGARRGKHHATHPRQTGHHPDHGRPGTLAAAPAHHVVLAGAAGQPSGPAGGAARGGPAHVE